MLQKWSKRSRLICASQLVRITSRCFPASTVFRNDLLWRETLCLQGKSISGGAAATHPSMWLAAPAAEPSAVESALAAINPDALSPREALEALYKLRGLLP